MKTQEQIIQKLTQRREEQNFLDFFPEVVIPYLTFDQAKQFLKEFENQQEEADLRSEWKTQPLDAEAIKKEMADYMVFAWGKAEHHRGLSANRSVNKMQAWTWLLDKDEEIDWDNYQNYGCPILKQVCEVFGLPIPDSSWLVNMMNGKSCTKDCEMGCGQ